MCGVSEAQIVQPSYVTCVASKQAGGKEGGEWAVAAAAAAAVLLCCCCCASHTLPSACQDIVCPGVMTTLIGPLRPEYCVSAIVT